jgi:tRNA A-37 threonylcarbamoyl transferase component Bud32
VEASFEPGAEFAGHRIDGELGRGGMGVVYAATHLALGRQRALKVLAPAVSDDEAAAERFRREARMAASIDHPALIPVHDAGEADGRLYISMRLIDGVDLALLFSEGALEPRRAVAIIRRVAEGLDAAHAAGLVHRDVKPANVMVEAADDRELAYLGDFGIGMLLEADRDRHLTGTGQVLGTIDYMSPEQIEGGALDGRADVYSLACVSFEALTGTVPFAAETRLAALHAHGSAPRPSAVARRPALPEAVDGPLARAMAIDPSERTATAIAFVDELEAALGGIAGGPHARPTAPLIERPPRGSDRGRGSRLRIIGLAGAAGAALVAVIAAMALLGEDEGAQQISAAVTIDVARDPVAVAAGANYVWVASGNAGRVAAFDAESGEPAGIAYAVDQPRALALGAQALWVVNAEGLLRLALDGKQKAVSPVELTDPSDVAVDGRNIWVLDRGVPPRAVRIDGKSLDETGDAFVGTDPQGIAYGAGSIWVTNAGEGTVSEIDSSEAERIGSPIEVGGRPQAIAASGGRVWLVDNFGSRLVPIDPSGEVPSVQEPVETLPRPRSVALGLDSVWVTSGEAGALQRFSAGDEPELLAEASVGDEPADVSVGASRAWTADSGSDTVSGVDP